MTKEPYQPQSPLFYAVQVAAQATPSSSFISIIGGAFSMTLNKTTKTAVILGTLWVPLYPLLFIGFMLALPLTTILFNQTNPAFFDNLFILIFPLHCLTALILISLNAFYLIHIIKNNTASDSTRIIFTMATFFMPYIAMPIYCYLYIWLPEPPKWARTTKPPAPIDKPTIQDPATIIHQLKTEEAAKS